MPRAYGDAAARFLGVSEWQGSVTHVLTESGGKVANGCTYTWSANHNADATMILERGLGFGGVQYWDSVSTSMVLNVTYSELLTADCGPLPEDKGEYTAIADQNRDPGNSFFIKVDASNNTYDVSILATVPSKLSATGCTSCPIDSGSEWYPTANITDLPLPPTNLTLSGSASIDLTGCNSCGAYFTTAIGVLGAGSLGGRLTVTWNFRPLSTNDLKVIIEPTGYDAWIPEGNSFDPVQRGNQIDVKATLLNKNGTATTRKAQKFTFELMNVSNEPGVCMNFPRANIADGDFDLRFDLALMPVTEWILLDGGLRVQTVAGEYSQKTAKVSAYDYGAYGELRVTAEVDGETIVGVLKLDETKKMLLLPKREPNHFIAEAWKTQRGVSSLDDLDDEENDPVGDMHKGDGLSLYEEYRGFLVNLKHLRTNPKKKDLFIRNEIGTGDSRQGIGLFEVESGLEVHGTLRSIEIADDNLINFNHSTDDLHVVDQHGVRIKQGKVDTGYSAAFNLPGYEKNSTPGTKSEIVMSPGSGSDATGSSLLGSDGNVQFTRSTIPYKAAVQAHETAHCCAVYHHGEGDVKVPWTLGVSGTNSIPTLFESGTTPITLRYENALNLDLPANLVAFTNAAVWIGKDHGQHSGDDNCFMCYPVSEAYVYKSNPMFRLLVRTRRGLSLCTSASGTGVNDPTHQPQSRYGDAAEGNCKGQLCVNDFYRNDSLHDR